MIALTGSKPRRKEADFVGYLFYHYGMSEYRDTDRAVECMGDGRLDQESRNGDEIKLTMATSCYL